MIISTERNVLQQTFSAFQQRIAPSPGQGEQKYSKCMKMSTPTSLWCTEVECGKGLLK